MHPYCDFTYQQTKRIRDDRDCREHVRAWPSPNPPYKSPFHHGDLCRLLETDESSLVETPNRDNFDDKTDKCQVRVRWQDDDNGKAVFKIWSERDDEVLIRVARIN